MSRVEFHLRAKQRELSRSHDRYLKYDYYFATEDLSDDVSPETTHTFKQQSIPNNSARNAYLYSPDDMYCSPPSSPLKPKTPVDAAKERKRNHNEMVFASTSPTPGIKTSPGKDVSLLRSPIPLKSKNLSKIVSSSHLKSINLNVFPSTVDAFEERIISQVYGVLYRNNRPRSASILSCISDEDPLDDASSISSGTTPLVPVEYTWFRKIFRPFVTKSKQQSIKQSMLLSSSIRNQPHTGIIATAAVPCFESFGVVTDGPESTIAEGRNTVPSFEMFGVVPPLGLIPAEPSTQEVLDRHLDMSFLCELTSHLFFQDYRLYSPTLELSKAVFLGGSPTLRLHLTEMLINFTSERCLFFSMKESVVLMHELSDIAPYSYGHDHNIVELIDYMLAEAVSGGENNTSISNDKTFDRLLANISSILLNILRCNHGNLCVEKKYCGSQCSPSSLFRCFQGLFCRVKLNQSIGNYSRLYLTNWAH
jgi:hypothetical protein